MTAVEMDWVTGGVCGQVDPELWFSASYEDKQWAAAICRSCDVQAQCNEWAEKTQDPHSGVLAGYTSRQRKNIRAGRPVRRRGRPKKV